MSMSSNLGRYRVRNPPTIPGMGGTWGPNPYTLYGSSGRTHTPQPPSGMQDPVPFVVVPHVPLVPLTIEPQVFQDPCHDLDPH